MLHKYKLCQGCPYVEIANCPLKVNCVHCHHQGDHGKVINQEDFVIPDDDDDEEEKKEQKSEKPDPWMDKNRDPWNHPKQKEMLKPEDLEEEARSLFQKAPRSFLENQEERRQMDKRDKGRKQAAQSSSDEPHYMHYLVHDETDYEESEAEAETCEE